MLLHCGGTTEPAARGTKAVDARVTGVTETAGGDPEIPEAQAGNWDHK